MFNNSPLLALRDVASACEDRGTRAYAPSTLCFPRSSLKWIANQTELGTALTRAALEETR